jgi:hypothetical protein
MKYFLLLSVIGLCWAQYSPNTQQGRTSIVHLFEWRWADIAKECERYLAPHGFGGVQVSFAHSINFRIYCAYKNGILISLVNLKQHITSRISTQKEFSEEEKI